MIDRGVIINKLERKQHEERKTSYFLKGFLSEMLHHELTRKNGLPEYKMVENKQARQNRQV